MENNISELVYDSSSFIHSYRPFTYVLKESPDDFIVHEIAEDLKEADECDKTIPDPPIEELETVVDANPAVQAKPPADFYVCDEHMKAKIDDFVEKAKSYGFKDVLSLSIPDNKKLAPEVLEELSVSNPHISIRSRAGSIEFSRNNNVDSLVDMVGEDTAKKILSFLVTSRIDKSESSHSFSFPAMEDKDARRSFHLFCKQKYPFVRTSTSQNQILLTIYPNRKRNAKSIQTPSKRRDISRILQFTLKKTNTELMGLRIRLAEILGVSQRALGFAGIKDKKAITYQFATISGVSPDRLLKATEELPGIEIGGLKYVKHPLEIGHLWGNRFCLTLRQVSSPVDDIARIVPSLEKDGFVNYYGNQRFGGDSATEMTNVKIGQFLVKGDWQKALQCLLTPNQVIASEYLALTHFQETSDAKASARMLPASSHVLLRVMRGLRRYGCENLIKKEKLSEEENKRCFEVLKEIPVEIVTFFVKSFQSYLFNAVLQWRIRKFKNATIPGDLVQCENEVIVSTSPESIEKVVLPLLGTMVKLPENEVGEYYSKLVEMLIGTEMKELRSDNPFVLYGSYRRIVAKPKDLSCCMNDRGIQLDFKLERGVYATTMLREMSGGNSPVCYKKQTYKGVKCYIFHGPGGGPGNLDDLVGLEGIDGIGEGVY